MEFLFEPRAQAFFFMEVNTRLQVEHTVTEVTTGLDLVKLQLHVARGGRLEGEPPRPSGHAIEVRLNAEDPDSGFAPAPGTFALFRLPTGPGIRIDRGVTEGDRVPPEFDSMVAKIIARGRDRPEALARLRRALAESAIVLEGGTTNRAFLLDLISRPEVRSAEVDTAWLERAMAEPAPPRPHADAAFAQAAIEVYESEFAREQAHFYETAARLRPEAPHDSSQVIELHHGGQSYKARVLRLGAREYRLAGRRPAASRRGSSRSGASSAGSSSGSVATASSPSPRAPGTSSRWMASPIASPAPTSGSCARRPPRWWCRWP